MRLAVGHLRERIAIIIDNFVARFAGHTYSSLIVVVTTFD